MIRAGTFAFVGGNAAAPRFAGDTAVVHDLEGRFAMPGIIDSHTASRARFDARTGRPGAAHPPTSREDILAWLRDYSRSHWYSPVIITDSWPVSSDVTGYAEMLRLEDVAGSIEIGKHADLVILDLNPFQVDRSAIHGVQPTAVFLGGRVTFGDLH